MVPKPKRVIPKAGQTQLPGVGAKFLGRHHEQRVMRAIYTKTKDPKAPIDRRIHPKNSPMGRAQLLDFIIENHDLLKDRAIGEFYEDIRGMTQTEIKSRKEELDSFLRVLDETYKKIRKGNLETLVNYAERDEKTLLLTAQGFITRIRQYVTNPHRVFGYFVIDMNNLKRINDGISHTLGDSYLRTMGEIGLELQKIYAQSNIKFTFARTGGDEFEILLSMPRDKGYNYEETAKNFIRQIRAIGKKRWDEKRTRVATELRIAEENIPEISFAVGSFIDLKTCPITITDPGSYERITPEQRDNIDLYIEDIRDKADRHMQENKAEMKERRR